MYSIEKVDDGKHTLKKCEVDRKNAERCEQ